MDSPGDDAAKSPGKWSGANDGRFRIVPWNFAWRRPGRNTGGGEIKL